jgi:hypothetical protein
VLGAIRALNRLECIGETLRHALNSLAVIAPEWLRGQSQPQWVDRYGPRVAAARLPDFDNPVWLWMDIDVTPLPIGAQAKGSERTWMGRCRSKTGRKVLRVTASDYREVLHETLLHGKASALPALKAALRELEARLHWTRERWARVCALDRPPIR